MTPPRLVGKRAAVGDSFGKQMQITMEALEGGANNLREARQR